MEDQQPGHIMFLRRFHVHNHWDISPGAVLDLSEAQPGLVDICRGLYKEDKDWFIGDVDALFDDRYISI